MEAYLNAPKQGLNTLLNNKKLIDWGKIFLDLSKRGLEKRNELNKSGKNETIYLKHIADIIKNKKTRADMLVDQFNKTKNLNFLVNHDENFSYSGF
jgi:glutamate--cysteine ligase